MKQFFSVLVKGFLIITVILMAIAINGCEANEKDIPPPAIHINMPETGLEIELEDTLIINPKITYDYDSNYKWYLNDEIISTEKNLKHIGTELGSTVYTFVIESPRGNDSIVIPVNTIILIHFSEFELNRDSVNVGLNLYPTNPGFKTKGTVFPTIAPSENQWVGFALSNRINQRATEQPNRFTAYGTTSGLNNFMIYHQPNNPYAVAFYFEDKQERVISSISITNSKLAFLIMRHGTVDGIRRFGGDNNDIKDWFILTLEGFDANGIKTGEVKFPLADFRFDNHRQNYIINNWQRVNLLDLGKVNSVSLSLSTSMIDENGAMMTPPYVCIDNIRIVE